MTTRETRAAAAEIKFLIHPALAPRIRAWARINLQPDPHGGGPFGDEYETASLYFDTQGLDVFHRRQSHGRAKYRIRRYGSSSTVFFERKLRTSRMLVKRRTMDSVDALARLENGTTTVDWAGEWFRRRLAARGLHAVCQVSYHRMARLIDTADGVARLTLDTNLRAGHTSGAAFAGAPAVPFLSEHVILELKYRNHPPAAFKRLIESFALTATTASKYRLGMAALGHGAPAVATSTQAASNVSYA